MTVEAVVGRIDQILQLQQSLFDPAAAAGAAAPAAAPASATGSGGAGVSPDFATALASAQGLTGTAGATATGGVSLTGGSVPTAVQAMIGQANALVGLPYVWGGGHGGWGPTAGYDCSGFVSKVLHAGGFLTTPADTTTLPSQPGMESGPGQYVTVYDRAQPGDTGHVIIEIDGQFYESGGSQGTWGGGGGVQRIARPSDAYLATFTTVLHPAGL